MRTFLNLGIVYVLGQVSLWFDTLPGKTPQALKTEKVLEIAQVAMLA